MLFLQETFSKIIREVKSITEVFVDHLAHIRPSKLQLRPYLKKDPLIASFLVFTLASPALAFFPTKVSDVKKMASKDDLFENARTLVRHKGKDKVITSNSDKVESDEIKSDAAPTATTEEIAPVEAPKKERIVSGWLPSWDQNKALNSMTENPNVVDELSPFWYELTPSGHIEATGENQKVLDVARSQDQTIIPTIHNNFKGERVERIISDPAERDRLINDIDNLVNQNGFDGIDIDFEAVSPEYRNDFTGFVQVLGDRLHSKGKILSVTVMPKTSEPGSPYGAASQDYAAIAAASDRVRIMAYDNHYQGGDPGPVAPANWVDELLAYATTVIPREKLILGVPSYGYDWAPSGGRSNGRGVTFDNVMSLANQHQRPIDFDGNALSPVLTYEAGGVTHYVWFENARSLSAKLDIANKHDIGGIAIWRLGGEDPGNWDVIEDKLGK